jgi:hypothetical protein
MSLSPEGPEDRVVPIGDREALYRISQLVQILERMSVPYSVGEAPAGGRAMLCVGAVDEEQEQTLSDWMTAL